MARDLPNGLLTLLFSDIAASTEILERVGSATYAAALASHRSIVREALDRSGGIEVDTQGDSFFAVFRSTRQGVAAAADIVRRTDQAAWPDDCVLRPRLGIHYGEPLLAGNGYVGSAVHRASRICGMAHGGQVLVSAAVARSLEERIPSTDAPDNSSEQSEPWVLEDLGDFSLKGLAQAERLFQLIIPGLRSAFPTLAGGIAQAAPLPIYHNTFVGRSDERTALADYLSAPGTITLTGPGGSGKTRLALQIGAEVAEQRPGSVWFADISLAESDADVLPAVAAVAGVSEASADGTLGQVAARLAARGTLLIMDNCEQVIRGASAVATELQQRTQHLTILATSRAPLGVRGERVWPLDPLDVPNPSTVAAALDGDHTAMAACASASAIQLFVERARSAYPAFDLDRRTLPAVARLCETLDGLPLAIELAAARSRAMSVDDLARRVAQRLDILANPDLGARPRHQSLNTLLDWSHGLLTAAEQGLFARLVVFHGGWSIDSAESVCAGEGIASEEIAPLLASLVDQSLVAVIDGPTKRRYRLLNLIGRYGRARWTHAVGYEHWRDRHARYFSAFAARVAEGLHGPAQSECLAELQPEDDNLSAALAFWREIGDAESGISMAEALAPYWELSGRWAAGRRALAGFIEAADSNATVSSSVLARAHTAAGGLARQQGDLAGARRSLEAAARLLGDGDEAAAQANVLRQLGSLADEVGDTETALETFERALALYEALGDEWGIAAVKNNWGVTAYHLADYTTARELLGASQRGFARLGESWASGITEFNLGNVAFDSDDLDEAEQRYAGALAVAMELEDPQGIANASNGLGHVARRRGDYGTARTSYEASAKNLLALADEAGLAEWLVFAADLLIDLHRHEAAAAAVAAADSARDRLGAAEARKEAQVSATRSRTLERALSPSALRYQRSRGEIRTLDESVEAALAALAERTCDDDRD